jgi:hypothetical protein
MPKTQPKPRSEDKRKARPNEKKAKAPPTTPSIFKSKNYWIFLSILILVLGIALGYLAQISLGKELLMLTTIFALIGFAFHLGYRPAPTDKKRVLLIIIGASIIGFIIWAVMILFVNASGLLLPITSSTGTDFFAVASLIICLVLGAFIGDLIGKNMETILFFAHKFRSRVSDSAPKKVKP